MNRQQTLRYAEKASSRLPAMDIYELELLLTASGITDPKCVPIVTG